MQKYHKKFETSPRVTDVRRKMVDINLRSVVATTSIGGGLTALRKLCTNFNFTQPVHEKQYNNYLKHVVFVISIARDVFWTIVLNHGFATSAKNP